MTIVECSACGKTTPDLRFCIHCQNKTNTNQIPTESEAKRNISKERIDAASVDQHKTVTSDVLNSDHEKYNRRLGTYLFGGEQPVAICELDRTNISAPNQDNWSVKGGFWSSGHLIISDQRLLCVMSVGDVDQIFSISYEDVIRVESETALVTFNTITVELVDGCSCEYELEQVSDKELGAITLLAQEYSDKRNSEASRTAQLENSIDSRIEAADDASEAFSELTALFEQQKEITQTDRAIEDADSLTDLISTLADQQERSTQEIPPSTTLTNQSPTNLPANSSVGTRIKSIARDAEPKEVGKYAVGASLALGTFAVTLPYSTTLGVVTLLTGGGAVGAYASANPDSAVADVDPIRLGLGMRSRGIARKNSSTLGGYGAGAASELLEQVDAENASSEYAEWVANIDPDLIMEDTQRAVDAAERSSESFDPTKVKAIGGTFGLAHSYINNSSDIQDLENLLDDDLYQEAIEELEK